MATVTQITAWLATTCTIGLFLSSLPTCITILKKKSTGDVNFFPFIAMFCNATLWMKYGLLKGDVTLVIVNSVGAILNLMYIFVYYFNTLHKTAVFKQLALGGLVLFPVLIYTQYFSASLKASVSNVGISCCVVGVVAYGAPLSAITKVIRSKSTETMVLPLSVANFVVSTEWTVYGYLMTDINIMVPNGLGMVLGILQLSLFVMYPSKSVSQSPNKTTSMPAS